MRIQTALRLGILTAVLAALTSCSMTAGLPKEKLGLWEWMAVFDTAAWTMHLETLAVDAPTPNSTIFFKMCNNGKPNEALLEWGEQLRRNCTSETHVFGTTSTADGVCHLEHGQQTIHIVTTRQGMESRQEIRIHQEYPWGKTDSRVSIAGKWTSRVCPAGLRPGDAVDADGNTISQHLFGH